MQTKKKSKLPLIIYLVVALILIVAAIVSGRGNPEVGLVGTGWALLPPILAIGLALITKEVYVSLFFGCAVGSLFISLGNPIAATEMLFGTMIDKVSGNMGIVIFLVVLGIVVALMNKSGGSKAYGDWARKAIKTRKTAQLATFGLGVLIFVDDYFNCLTVGSVMRPVTDAHNISRAKLAYLIDSTAAPVCIIAPISSWAAAVAGMVPGTDGLQLFMQAIPFNYYALLTLLTVVLISIFDIDFGPMKTHEYNAKYNGDLYTTPDRPYADAQVENVSVKGKVIDLVIPVLVLIATCIVGLIYTGGFFDAGGETYMDLVNAFASCDAYSGLMYGGFMAILFAFIYYVLVRRNITFTEFTDSIPAGFKQMVPAILILTFAWTISGITGALGAADFVAAFINNYAEGLRNLLPAIIFLIACGLAFATGTSWGTFGILIPIIVAVFPSGTTIQVIGISACMAGAVMGDHCSPISDTTIMSSTGAQCNHLNHVGTQIPYVLTVAAVCFVSYLIAGFVQNVVVNLIIAIILMVAVLFIIKYITGKNTPVAAKAAK
ncbi:tetracycline efflux Na+/H+ antiporter family transporter Tet(35) [Oscillospiraceae bacterium]|nr:tetracycline efflux Na+/H+ antiporter family transporter Tet(35) [Oscillospiraceae bacterium]BDF74100.1 tetracycline efflux Na+/H+ antiporter family transporter Tet(35) [Oscillospiraceae bacterium]